MYDDGEVEAGNQTGADCGKRAEGLTFLLIGPFLRLKKKPFLVQVSCQRVHLHAIVRGFFFASCCCLSCCFNDLHDAED